MICRRVAERAKRRRDGYVDADDVIDAVHNASRDESLNIFSHFWTDGIFESGAQMEGIASRRRRLFYAIGDVLRREELHSRTAVLQHPMLRNLGVLTIESELQDLHRRDILSVSEDRIEFRVPLFREWLMSSGTKQLLTYSAEDDLIAERKRVELVSVHADEIDALSEHWIYQGRHIGFDLIQPWLRQFGPDVGDQRLMFTLLSSIRYYNQQLTRERMLDAFTMVAREYQSVKTDYKIERDEYLVSFLDDTDKIGSHMGQLFAEENRLFPGSVVDRFGGLRSAIVNGKKRRALILVDDFLETSEHVRSLGRAFWREQGAFLDENSVDVHFICVAGYETAYSELVSAFKKAGIKINVRVCDLISESARAFATESKLFGSESDAEKAFRLVQSCGERILPKNPMGLHDAQSLVVFEHRCPSSSLPILWKEQKGIWKPLFPRV